MRKRQFAVERAISLAVQRTDGRVLEVDGSPKLRDSMIRQGLIAPGADDGGGKYMRYYLTPVGRAANGQDMSPAAPVRNTEPAHPADVFVVLALVGYDKDELVFAGRSRAAAHAAIKESTWKEGHTLIRQRNTRQIEAWHIAPDGTATEIKT